MTKENLIDLLKQDLINEYEHMLFYLNASCQIRGLGRVELGEWLGEEARDEMNHVEQFIKLIVELSGDFVESPSWLGLPKEHETYTKPSEILKHVLAMEENVVERYTQRMDDAMALGGVDGRYVEIFLEDQILDSKSTAAHVRLILAGM
jgi:ferritin